MKILLEEHNPAWTIEFVRVRDDLLATLKDIPIRSIEHVGFILNAKDGSGNVRDDTGEKEMRRNVYVTLDGCVSLRDHLGLKRMLLEHDELWEEYEKVKRKIVAGRVHSTLEYCKKKTDVLVKILRTAGWEESELEEHEGGEVYASRAGKTATLNTSARLNLVFRAWPGLQMFLTKLKWYSQVID
ncbi:hypothetical protein BDZ45DRAFT_754538 [Acephala macrosclerotiorum]|nr:hypothetical protein BDZ45DRAFT_754538 [Acephala macrosclerotiorum]